MAGSCAYDWYIGFEALKSILCTRIPSPSAEILIPGCGLSEIPRALYDEGYRNITAIDTSAVAISAQTASEECEIEFCVMDVCRLEFPSNIFDVIIDKALLDVLATCYDSTRSARAVEEIYRVLEQGGVFVCVSHAPPERRLNLLTLNGAAHWRIEVTKLAKLSVPFIDLDAPGCFFVYICTKEAGENCHATSLVT
eukprot:GEMP01053222.1.p1 GENE.GEMP01053222.1~~GEMP01053222.1.p1  ORF type:complete len:196 (+),score=42.17 GEMP01053222.1:392-979(+)